MGNVIPFPVRAIDSERLAQMGERLKTAVPLETRDAQLDELIIRAGLRIDNYDNLSTWLRDADRVLSVPPG